MIDPLDENLHVGFANDLDRSVAAIGDTFADLPDSDRSRRMVLRRMVFEHLIAQGFKVSESGVLGAIETDKPKLRELHAESVAASRQVAKKGLVRYEERFLARLASGDSVVPSEIKPRLILVDDRRSFDGLFWRWASLHWSVPVSSGYGRRLRFLVVDEGNSDALMGLIGLGDPVYALRCRDMAIGWTPEARKRRLASVMDAFVLGAVPPYADLLGGKLMALLSTCSEIQDIFARKYGHRRTLIAGRDPDCKLALVTTSSALGRSSVYNRLRREDSSFALEPVGYTRGTGDFHFSGDVYAELAKFAIELDPGRGVQRHERWGSPGFRNRREVLHLALSALGFDARALRSHGVRRQVFMSTTAANACDYLCGRVDWLDRRSASSTDELSDWWLRRWALPRSRTTATWQDVDPLNWRLYK